MSPAAFPLTWPTMFPRAKSREAGRFKTALPVALKHVQDSLRLFGVDSNKRLTELVISSDVTLGVAAPADPGVAVWFTWDGLQVCIPVDRYDSVASNLQAIHLIVEARRVELRYGTLPLVRATFQGFLALPAPKGEHWTEVLDLPKDASADAVKAAHRKLASWAHPDRSGGSNEAMARNNTAYDAALKECRP